MSATASSTQDSAEDAWHALASKQVLPCPSLQLPVVLCRPVRNRGCVKLADFGASRKIEDLATVGSGSKSIRGTPYWMAPEVCVCVWSYKASLCFYRCAVRSQLCISCTFACRRALKDSAYLRVHGGVCR